MNKEYTKLFNIEIKSVNSESRAFALRASLTYHADNPDAASSFRRVLQIESPAGDELVFASSRAIMLAQLLELVKAELVFKFGVQTEKEKGNVEIVG